MSQRYAFYPGCTLHSTGVEFGVSTELVCDALDLEMVEITDDPQRAVDVIADNLHQVALERGNDGPSGRL